MNPERVLKVLLSPHVSEKAANLSDQSDQYVFRVVKDATKPEIRAAVERMFDVSVTDVKVVNMKGKAKRFGRRLGRRSDWKKAYVRLAAGQEIDFFHAE